MNSSGEPIPPIPDVTDPLDQEFREMLCLIKNCIQYVSSNYYLSQYKTWLEKVNDAPESEKVVRNFYLRELAKQIQQNSLAPPFNQQPPDGPLTIPTIFKNLSAKFSENYEYVPSSQDDSIWPYDESEISDMSVFSHYSAPSAHYFGEPSTNTWSETSMHNVHKHSSMGNLTHSSMGNLTQIQESWEPQGEPSKKELDRKLRRSKFRKLGGVDNVEAVGMYEGFAEAGVVQEVQKENTLAIPRCRSGYKYKPNRETITSIKEDSSWCDLTDVDSVTLEGSGDGEKLLKADTQETGDNLEENPTEDEQNLDNCNNFCITNENDSNDNTTPTSQERARMIMLNLMDTKVSLKDTNFISEDWKNTIEGLQMRLTETVNQNNELKNVVKTLQLNIENGAAKYHEDLQRSLRECESQHHNEVKTLNQLHLDKIGMAEKSYEAKLEAVEKAHQVKMSALVENYEMRIRELRHDHENCVQGKENEIRKLTDLIDSQCERTINAIAELRSQVSTCKMGEEKIQILQKCVSKMDKMFQKAEKEYQKQIEKLKQELDLKDKAMQIHLNSQRAEILAINSEMKQGEFDDIINNLEVKYIKMLEQHETQTMAARKEDNARINRLLTLLNQYDVPYDLN